MKQFHILLLLLPLSTIAQTSKIEEQRRPFNLNKLIISKVSLVQSNDTLISFNASDIKVFDKRESDFNALGAYDDWQKND